MGTIFWGVAAILMWTVFGFFVGRMHNLRTIGQLKYENTRINEELKKLTDRDARGRFVKRK